MKAFNNLILAALLAATPSPALAKKKDDAVLLSKVKSLTLRDGQRTSHRRVDALPQLNCVGGDGCQFYKVDTMRCTNSGSEYDTEDIQWTCKASLPPEFKLGSTDVICEGYDNADDPYILKGSCGVEYRLMLTELGEEKYRDHIGRGAWRSWNGKQGNGGDWLASVLFWLVFASIIGVILYNVFFPNQNNQGRPRHGFRGGYGGGGGPGNDDDDPPPPYTPRANPRPRKSNNSGFFSGLNSGYHGNSTQQNQGWRPGFWSSTAAGAAAGYAAGALGNRDRQQQPYGGPSYFGGGSSGRSSNWGGGSGRASSSNSPPTPSSSRTESTGFGGTRRR